MLRRLNGSCSFRLDRLRPRCNRRRLCKQRERSGRRHNLGCPRNHHVRCIRYFHGIALGHTSFSAHVLSPTQAGRGDIVSSQRSSSVQSSPDSQGVSSTQLKNTFGFSGAFAIVFALLTNRRYILHFRHQYPCRNGQDIGRHGRSEPGKIGSRHLVSTRRPAGGYFQGAERAARQRLDPLARR